MKKKIVLMLAATMVFGTVMAGCGSKDTAEDNTPATETDGSEDAAEAVQTGNIHVVSREDGSGTRGAFIELFGVEQKNDAGEKVDMTTMDAEVTNSTAVMMTTVSGNDKAIGYISLGSMDESVVKALKIDGVEATVENVKSGDYKVSRPFNIVTNDDLSEVAQDFVNFILSEDGQAVVEDNGYISLENTGAYEGTSPAGKVTVAGSSSVTPVMEKLAEAYAKVNANATIEVQQSDSTTGVNSVMEGICDIGMASRNLKEEETGVTATVIAQDGIAVIVSLKNGVDDLTSEQIMKIYTGEVTTWDEINE